MDSFDRAWDVVKIVPDLMGSDESWHNHYQELFGKPYGDSPPEGLFVRPEITESNPKPKGHILINLPRVATGSSFNMIDDANEIEDMDGFEEMLAASRNVSHPLFERRFAKDLIRNYLHELGHALTIDDVINWKIEDMENRDLTRGWESLAHILQDPHDANWREAMKWHSGVGWG